MLICLVVTFSRGVWIATAISILVVIVLGGYVFRDQLPQLQIPRRTKILALIPLGDHHIFRLLLSGSSSLLM
jgi:hypothetical protein